MNARPEPAEVVITGIGMVTPAGPTSAASWKTVCEGRPTAVSDPRLAGHTVDFSCALTGFDAEGAFGSDARRMALFTQFAVAAAREAVADAGLVDPGGAGQGSAGDGPGGEGNWDRSRTGVLLGTAVGGLDAWQAQGERLLERGPRSVNPLTVPMAIGNTAPAAVAMDLGLHGPALSLSTACAASTTALGFALDLLRSGRCDVVLAGGTESGTIPLVSVGFDRLKALSRRSDDPAGASRPFDRDRDGFVLSEGAAVLVLERARDARARGRRGYARLLGYGETADAHHRTAPDPGGHAARLAVTRALADAGVSASDIDLVNAHATSTPTGDAIEARLVDQVFGGRSAVTSTKGVTGHMLGAAGAVEAAFTALSVHHGVIPATANFGAPDPDMPDIDLVHGAARHTPVSFAVSNSFGFGGHNAVVVLGSP
ncbi:beta-ketoacyl-[acyl-carrier-protein] synthase family protein [Streptomyces sp. NBC_01104]|uniref:beta-ketoacyl-[acyl-carrier-protein] synthase family protein n=1 Tax=Streptomyces sp. NBC_01104 TaxID=2903750 RepID=UPI003870628E|nr:beta-ketoacyl-[acyl-carrier-protein] synthase family protein [Streptomyces sp. NBC_01104]